LHKKVNFTREQLCNPKGERERKIGFLPCRTGRVVEVVLYGYSLGVWLGGNIKVMPNCATAKALFLVTR